MKVKPKVIILYNKIFHYRVPVWNELAKYCDLTVTYSEGEGKVPEGMECLFDTMYLPASRFMFIVWHRDDIRNLVKNYDAIIAYGNIAWLKFSTLPWFSNNKVIFHAIGVSASYSKGFDQKKGWDRIRAFFYGKAAALAFYTDYPIDKYTKLGISKDRMFVAPNTVLVKPIDKIQEKDSILMMGTLYKEKGINLLLDVYLKLCDSDLLPRLNIVGGGPDFEYVKDWVKSNRMEKIISVVGPVYDINKKAEYFNRALACISPKQAGLTVLESMGYGVPFVTTKNAITGGELFNVHNGIDGIIMDDESQLIEVIRDISRNRNRYIEMGKKAKKFYIENRTVNHMANGLWDAIQYVINKND